MLGAPMVRFGHVSVHLNQKCKRPGRVMMEFGELQGRGHAGRSHKARVLENRSAGADAFAAGVITAPPPSTDVAAAAQSHPWPACPTRADCAENGGRSTQRDTSNSTVGDPTAGRSEATAIGSAQPNPTQPSRLL